MAYHARHVFSVVNSGSKIENPLFVLEMNNSVIPLPSSKSMDLKPDLSPHRQQQPTQRSKGKQKTPISVRTGTGVRIKQKINSKPLVNVGSDWSDWGSSKKPVSVNHLLNFTFPERQQTFSNYQKRTFHGNFSKEKFVNAKYFCD